MARDFAGLAPLFFRAEGFMPSSPMDIFPKVFEIKALA
jgi:hypothetical protein